MASNITQHRPSRDHHHEMSLDDTFDFLNTTELESGSLVDHFTSFDNAARWLIGPFRSSSSSTPRAVSSRSGSSWPIPVTVIPVTVIPVTPMMVRSVTDSSAGR